MTIGEEGLGEYAREQLAVARRDRRLERGHGAMIDDFGLAVEEVERTRAMSRIGLGEICCAYERAKAEFDTGGDDHRGEDEVQVLWQRAEFAQAEIDNDYPAINAHALTAMNGALDGLIQYLAPAVRDLPFLALMQRSEEEVPEAVEQLTPEIRRTMIDSMQEILGAPKLKDLGGKGAARYERRLEGAGLSAGPDRPIPIDLDMALREVGVIRDCLVHRAGRVDAKALRIAPSLAQRYADGDLIRLGGDDYRTYSAAIRCYGAEVIGRVYAGSPDLADSDGKPDLDHWRDCHLVDA